MRKKETVPLAPGRSSGYLRPKRSPSLASSSPSVTGAHSPLPWTPLVWRQSSAHSAMNSTTSAGSSGVVIRSVAPSLGLRFLGVQRGKVGLALPAHPLDRLALGAAVEEYRDQDASAHEDRPELPELLQKLLPGGAGEVAEEAQADGPADAAGRVPECERLPLHPARARQPRRVHPQHRQPAADEDGLRP